MAPLGPLFRGLFFVNNTTKVQKCIDNNKNRCYNTGMMNKQGKENIMSDFTMAQAKRDFEHGYIKDWSIERFPIAGPGWFVMFRSMSGNILGWLIDAREKQPRQFKTLDAAVSSIEEVGFKVEKLLRG